jgi:hypothetical protein
MCAVAAIVFPLPLGRPGTVAAGLSVAEHGTAGITHDSRVVIGPRRGRHAVRPGLALARPPERLLCELELPRKSRGFLLRLPDLVPPRDQVGHRSILAPPLRRRALLRRCALRRRYAGATPEAYVDIHSTRSPKWKHAQFVT